MVVAQLLGIDSLRDLVGAISCSKERSLELRLEGCEPKKSTLADANNKRNWELFRDAFLMTLDKIKKISRAPDFGLEIKQQMYAIDSTVISLCTKVFEFAKYRQSKGGIKVHTSINVSEGSLPEFIEVTEGKAADIRSAGLLLDRIPAGSIITMDRGYIDYKTLYRINESGKFFVTRTKDEMKFTAVETPPELIKKREEETEKSFYDTKRKTTFNVIRDETVKPASDDSAAAYPKLLRIVTIKGDESGDEVEFLTNIMEEAGVIIAAIYKKRWEIENFFKTIKQHFHIKGFMGTSYNAVCCQIWSALTAIILIKYLIRISAVKWNFSNMINLFRSAGFICRRLSEWINISHCEPGADDQIPERRRKAVQQTGSLPFR
jgi:hypothetical protein